MSSGNIRGVILTLETLIKEPIEEGTRLVDGKPIRYWLGFISGYMIASIKQNDPKALKETLDLAPTLREIITRDSKEINDGLQNPEIQKCDSGSNDA